MRVISKDTVQHRFSILKQIDHGFEEWYAYDAEETQLRASHAALLTSVHEGTHR